MRIINTKCRVEWKTEKGLRRTTQTSFNVSFQEKKMAFSCNKKSRGSTTSWKTLVCSFSSFCWSQNVFFMVTCWLLIIQVSRVYLPSPGVEEGPFLPCVGLFKKVSSVLEAPHPQPPADGPDLGNTPVHTPDTNKLSETNMTGYFHSGLSRWKEGRPLNKIKFYQ